MGGVTSTLKRLVSADARKEHAAMKERVAKRIENAKKNIAARKAQEEKEVATLMHMIQDEVELSRDKALRDSLPSAPTHKINPSRINHR